MIQQHNRNRPTVRITIPLVAFFDLVRTLVEPRDLALRERLWAAYSELDPGAAHGPRIDLNATEIRVLARAVGYALYCWRQSRLEGVSNAPMKGGLRAVRDRIARHAVLHFRSVGEGYVVVRFRTEALAQDERARSEHPARRLSSPEEARCE